MQVVLVFTAGSSRAVRLADSADTNNSAIDPTWSTWQTMQSKFLQKQTELYGNWTSHYYSVCTDSHLCYTSWTERLSLTSQIDLYNELTPTSLDTAYLQNNTRSVVTSLRNTDPDAVWVMQGWMFVSDTKSWNKTTIPALLSGATDEEMVSTQASRGRDRVRVRRDPGALADE
jgi:alpha-N-acetylglucosaminidase